MAFTPDLEKARRIAKYVNAADSLNDLAERCQLMLRDESPDLQTLAAACGFLAPRNILPEWHEQARIGLMAPLQVALVEAQVQSQRDLSDAADRLARRNFLVALASMVVALASLFVSLAHM